MPSSSALTTENSDPPPTPRQDKATELGHVIKDIDYIVHAIDIDRIESLSFYIDDIPYHVTHKKHGNVSESRVCIQAILGYMPYSVESAEKRHAILTILNATHKLFYVRFGLDRQSRIFAAGNFTTDILTAPDFMFYPLSRFLQEARPFFDLIGQYL